MEVSANDSQILCSVIQDYGTIFEGLGSLVDVGGGTGTVSKAISEAFPNLKCTVLDRPNVVANLPNSKNLEYVGGDMFKSIPSANAVLIKSVLHMFRDEDCVKVLKLCREAVPSKNEGGKLILIERVINDKKDEHELNKAKLSNDVMMMIVHAGRDRNEKEWAKLFFEAGFSDYKITVPTLGLQSLMEVYP